jgi:hypothetical protein
MLRGTTFKTMEFEKTTPRRERAIEIFPTGSSENVHENERVDSH